MTHKATIKQEFQKLEKLLTSVTTSAPAPELIAKGNASPTTRPAFSELKDHQSSLILSNGSASVEPITIKIPGISELSEAPGTGLIRPITDINSANATTTAAAAASVSDASKERAPANTGDNGMPKHLVLLAAIAEAPLVALGLAEPKYLLELPQEEHSWWMHWWLSQSLISFFNDDDDKLPATYVLQCLGTWFTRCLFPKLSVELQHNPDGFAQFVQPYLEFDKQQQQKQGYLPVAWSLVVSALGVFQGRASHTSALSMAVWVVQQAVERGILDPAQSQQRIQQQPTTTGSTAAQRVEWTEYVQLVCSVPDRVYNRVDPRTIPHALTPAVYFARLARCVVEMAALVPADETSDINVGLWIKMCRVGEINSLCVEVASRLLLNGDQDTSGAGGRAEAEAEAVARAVGLVLVPFRARIVAGVARQLSMALGAQPTVSNALGERVSLAICTLLHAQLDADVSTDAVVRVVSALMDQTKTITTDCFPSSSALAFFQALALALQMLSGRLDVVPQGVPSRVYPQLLVDSLISVIIPQWSMADFVTHASAPEIKAMTALVMMCIGALSELDAQAVASSAEFMHAVPRFLDAPMAVTRLSGILVADCVVSKSNSMAKSNDQEKQGLDFGLDDIMREAKSGPPEVRASAAYIAEMRLYTRPIAQQWMQKATPDTDPLPPIEEEGEEGPASAVDQAVTFMRAYNGLEVVAPRQSSLTADTGESPLQSDFVKPRAPMFLRDCLLYMRDTQGKGSDMVQLGLFSLTQCIEAASEKMIREWWVQVANRVLYTYNRGADDLDREWNHERVRALVALAVRAPEAVGPFLADRACDRNLTLKDREIVYAAISTACLTLSGMEDELVAGSNHHQKQQKGDAMRGKISEVLKTTSPKIKEDSGIIGSGTVTRRSRRLDLVAVKPQAGMRSAEQKRYASTVGPAFFFPLMSQFGKSDMAPMTTSDVRRDMGQLERYVNTLAIILYTAAGSATHLITMNREFFDLFKMLKACSLLTPPVIDALLFGIDVVLSPERALSLPTLAREFREDISMIALWINELVEQGVVRADGGSIAHHVESIMRRLRDIQDDLSRRVTSGDFHKYTSVISI